MSNCKAFIGSLYSAHKNCDCGGTYERLPHAQYGILAPFCEDCGEMAPRLVVQRKIKRIPIKIRYGRRGEVITTMEAAIELSEKLTVEINNGTFDMANYSKTSAGTISETMGSFIDRVALRAIAPDPLDPEHEILNEYMAGFFSDTGIFAASQVHVELFLKYFQYKFKGDQAKDQVRSLFWKVIELARPQFTNAQKVAA